MITLSTNGLFPYFGLSNSKMAFWETSILSLYLTTFLFRDLCSFSTAFLTFTLVSKILFYYNTAFLSISMKSCPLFLFASLSLLPSEGVPSTSFFISSNFSVSSPSLSLPHLPLGLAGFFFF